MAAHFHWLEVPAKVDTALRGTQEMNRQVAKKEKRKKEGKAIARGGHALAGNSLSSLVPFLAFLASWRFISLAVLRFTRLFAFPRKGVSLRGPTMLLVVKNLDALDHRLPHRPITKARRDEIAKEIHVKSNSFSCFRPFVLS
jgi:hypothetical protein